jgi:dihydrofolate reductase
LQKPCARSLIPPFVSLDGVTADPGSWAIFDPDAGQEAAQELRALGGMLMGRGTYEYFADVMPKQTGPYADAINAIRKYVFSSTLERADWNNSTIIRDDVVTAVNDLKQQDGGDLMMYGHGRLSKTLLEHYLVDEIRFSIHPVGLCGSGWRQREEAPARRARQPQLSLSSGLVRCHQVGDHLARDEPALVDRVIDDLARPRDADGIVGDDRYDGTLRRSCGEAVAVRRVIAVNPRHRRASQTGQVRCPASCGPVCLASARRVPRPTLQRAGRDPWGHTSQRIIGSPQGRAGHRPCRRTAAATR